MESAPSGRDSRAARCLITGARTTMNETALTLEDTLKTLAERVVRSIPADGETTSWELKNRLHVSSSMLCLALGRLSAENKIRITPEQLNYRIALPEKPASGN